MFHGIGAAVNGSEPLDDADAVLVEETLRNAHAHHTPTSPGGTTGTNTTTGITHRRQIGEEAGGDESDESTEAPESPHSSHSPLSCESRGKGTVKQAGESGEMFQLTDNGIEKLPSCTPAQNRRNNIVSSLIAMLQGVEVFCSLAIMYLYKDDFGVHPASLGLIMAAIRLPWAVKPVWALLSDTRPILGYRRKSYVMIGALLCCLSTLGIGIWGYKNVYASSILLALYFLGSAICNVIGEALVVEAGRNCENGAADTVSTFFAFRKLSFAVMSYLSGWLLELMSKQDLFLVATSLPFVVFIAAFFLHERRCFSSPCVWTQVNRLREVVERPVLTNSTLFIFISMMTPSAGAAMFYFMTNHLNFGPELLGRMSLCQSVASLGGILCYRLFFSETSIRNLLLWSTLIITPFCLLPIIVVQRWNIALGVPDSVFVVTDNVLMEFLGEFQAMPILVLAARLCPAGLESTIYSFLLSGYNLGLALGSLLSAGLTATLGVTGETFTRLSALILICAVTNYLPLLVIGLVPTQSKIEEEVNKGPPGALISLATPTAEKYGGDGKNSALLTSPHSPESPHSAHRLSRTSSETTISDGGSVSVTVSSGDERSRAPIARLKVNKSMRSDTGGEV